MRADPADDVAEEGAPPTPAESAAEAKEEKKEAKPTAADVIAASAEVLKNKPLKPAAD